MSIHLRIWVALGAALAVAHARAAEGTSSPPESPRVLNGHLFQPSRLVTGPFTTTEFGMATVFGVGQALAPRYDIHGNQTGTKEYAVAAYGQDLEYQLRFTKDFSARVFVNGLIFSGVDAKGILVAGLTAQYGLGLGLTWGWTLSPTTRLALVADLSVQPQLSVLVGNAVLNAIETKAFSDTGVFSTVNRVTGNPGLSFAWAPLPFLGFVAEARYVWGHRTSSSGGSVNAQGVSLGGIASFDLNPLIHWPIAAQGVFRSELPVGSGGINDVQQVGAGVFYSGRPSLALGLEASWRHGKIRPGVVPTLKADSGSVAIMFRYYW
jgi:hypothetical protein